MLLAVTIRLLASVFGAALDTFLAVLLARKKAPARADRLLLAAAIAAGVWQAATATGLFHRAVAGRESALLPAILEQISIAAVALLPSLVLHFSILTEPRIKRAVQSAVYAPVPLAWWPGLYAPWLAVALGTSAALSIRASLRAENPAVRRFLAAFAVALAAVLAGAWAGGAALACAALLPPLVLAWFVYRYNLFGLQIGSRLLFSLRMGLVAALYLLLVRRLAGFAEEEFEAFGPLVEVALILAAAMFWLPLYGWMSRFLSRRTTLYADFSRRLIEDAARILDFPARVAFLAAEVGRTFGLRRVVVVTDPLSIGRYGPQEGDDRAGLDKLLAAARARGPADPSLAPVLSALGFNCLFPLRYEDRLHGLLLLDTSPRQFLGEDEPILEALSGQISQSLETARVIEEKMALENLAALGRAAATLAHEVKNPLSSIKTLAQLMREDPEVESRYARDLGFILGEVDRLDRTMRQLLSFARPPAACEEEVNLSEVLEIATEVLAREHAPAGIRIEHRIEPGLRLRKAGTEAVQQAVLNVALNAIQASSPGSAVWLEARADAPGRIAIAVTDEGPGIPGEIRARIFQPFVTTKQKGTGLGLAIVRKNVRQMRGAVEVESPVKDGRGTRVTITLPCE